MNPFLKKLLYSLEPETAHHIALSSLQIFYSLGLSRLIYKTPYHPCELMGLHFPNRVGLAAGFDKNADYVEALASLGFGFIEVGTLTPKPQAGNPRPRLFRLTEDDAIINRMGFNNKGVMHAVKKLEKTKYKGILGINIGKNRDTSIENAIDDYRFGFQQLWPFASYITVNISSPNTPGLRDLQSTHLLENLLTELKEEQKSVMVRHKKYVPLVLKIAPDLSLSETAELAQLLLQKKIDGVIATNTTIDRPPDLKSAFRNEAGGLSGKPLKNKSTEIIRELSRVLQNKIPIIASGGIMDAESAQEKSDAGASLIQIYSGLIYQGPRLIHHLNI
jgi:dihydroorotate dehydrogenase